MKKALKTGLGAFAGLVSAAVIATGAMAANLNGAGGTAIYPVLSVWAQHYQQKTGNAVNYQSIGSGGGIKQIEAKTVDFANSDKPLMHDDLASEQPRAVPASHYLDRAGRASAWHQAGATGDRRHRRSPTSIWARSPNGTIRRSRTQSEGAAAQHGDHRRASFRRFGHDIQLHRTISARSARNGRAKVGSDTSVEWPTGMGGKGNAGVAGSVQQTVGSIGYVEYAYAMQNNLTYTDMINAAGQRVKPTMEAFQAAAANADFSKVQDFYLILTEPARRRQLADHRCDLHADAQRLSGGARTRKSSSSSTGRSRTGQADSEKLDYVPFPDARREADRSIVDD